MSLPFIEELAKNVEQRVKKDVSYTGDLNEVNNTEIGTFAYNCSNMPWSSSYGGYLVTIKMSDNFLWQFAINAGTGEKYERIKVSGVWQAWENVMKIVPGAVTGDLNNYTDTGIYQYGGQDYPNKPTNFGILEVLRRGSFVVQKCTGAATICIRFSSNSGSTWSEWTTK